MIQNYDSSMLPICGITWHQFATEREAQRFADWAEWYTRRSEFPCTTFVNRRDDLDDARRWEVKVRNW